MNKQRIAIAIAGGVGMLATFMPWINVPLLGSINGAKISEYDGRAWLPLAIFAIPLIIAFIGDKTKSLIGGIKYAAFASGLINAIGGIMVIAYFKEIKKAFLVELGNQAGVFLGKDAMNFLGGSLEQAAEQAISAISISLGIYLMIVAGIGVCLISLFAKWFGNEEELAEASNGLSIKKIENVLPMLTGKRELVIALLISKRKQVIISLISLVLLIGIMVTMRIILKSDVDFSIVPVEGSNGEYQYIDLNQKGKIVINPQFGDANIFRGGLALVKTTGINGKYGYINKKGKYVVAPTYDYAQDFNEGVAWVQMENQPPMLINKKGEILMQIDSLTQAYPFVDGLAKVDYYSQGQDIEGFINKKGEIVIAAAEGEKISFMNDGLYAFRSNASKKWGFKNKQGEVVINEQFDALFVFIDGIAVVKVGDKYGVINKKGDFIINPQYEALIYDSDGLFVVKVGEKFGWINKKGEILINPQFDASIPFSGSNLAPVQMGSKWAYVDRKGQIVINPQFSGAFPFFGDYAFVGDYKFGFIDQKGNYVVSPSYSNISESYLFSGMDNLKFLATYAEFKSYARLNEKMEEYRKMALAAASGSFTDSRDNKTYKTIKIGKQTWMAENLNYAKSGECYNNEPANCQKYGKYFTWTEAKKACPSGWHLPSNAEWDALYRFADGRSGTESPYKSETAGKYLKATKGWNSLDGISGNGEDTYGFAALPGGSYYSGYDHAGNNGYWWSASEYKNDNAYYRFMLRENVAGWNKNSKDLLLNVRCLMD
jgi:uncharacterized protein (TIGR02145 family)